MSILVMSAVWKHSKQRGERLLLLLALADWSNDDGFCWPSIKSISEKTRITDRGAQQIVHDFIESGILEVKDHGGGRGNTPMYRIKGEPCSGFNFLKGEAEVPQRVNQKTVKGERGDTTIRNEPSLELSLEPPPTTELAVKHPIEEMFSYYVEVIGKNPKLYTLTEKRRKMGLARWEEALVKTKGDVENAKTLMEVAIDALADSDFHNARGEFSKNKIKYNSWEIVFRSLDQFEKFIDRSRD